MSGPAFGGGTFIADTSAVNRRSHPDVIDHWRESLRDGRILICPPVELELIYSARDAAGAERLSSALARLRRVPLADTCARAAVTAMRELAGRGPPGHHRVPAIDYLVAACAQEAGAGVLHYDRDFDRLAEVMGFESRWILPPGTVD